LGLLSMRTGEAQTFLGEFGPVQSGNNAVWMDLAARTGQAGQWDTARQYLEFNAAHNPTATAPLMALADIAMALKQPDRAAQSLQELTQQLPGDPEPWLKLADIALDTGRKRQAVQLLHEAAQRGTSAEAHAARQDAAGVSEESGTREIERTDI